MAEKRDYYDVLGVSKSIIQDEIKKAYWVLAKKYHPDANPGDKEVEAKFREASESYAVLSDPDKKKAYDQFGHAAFDPKAQLVLQVVLVDLILIQWTSQIFFLIYLVVVLVDLVTVHFLMDLVVVLQEEVDRDKVLLLGQMSL